jgi:hypothetical protein
MRRRWLCLIVSVFLLATAVFVTVTEWSDDRPRFLAAYRPIASNDRGEVLYHFKGDFQEVAREAEAELPELGFEIVTRTEDQVTFSMHEDVPSVAILKDMPPGDLSPDGGVTFMGEGAGTVSVYMVGLPKPGYWRRISRLLGF